MPSIFPDNKSKAREPEKNLKDMGKILIPQQLTDGTPIHITDSERELMMEAERKRRHKAKTLVYVALALGALSYISGVYSHDAQNFSGWFGILFGVSGIVFLIKPLLGPYGISIIGWIGVIAFILCFLGIMHGIGDLGNTTLRSAAYPNLTQ